MYKQKNKTSLEKFKHLIHWIKRKIILIIAAFMLGLSNAIYNEDEMINGSQNHTKQEQKED